MNPFVLPADAVMFEATPATVLYCDREYTGVIAADGWFENDTVELKQTAYTTVAYRCIAIVQGALSKGVVTMDGWFIDDDNMYPPNKFRVARKLPI